MNRRSKHFGLILTIGGGCLLLAAGASAQDGANATTRSLNTAPPQSTLPNRPAAQPPLARDGRSQPARPQSRTLDQALADSLGPTDEAPAAEGVTLAPGATQPDPIPITLGYYVRGELDCDQVWPGDGDLAWMTPTAFTIDFGGCEPGPFLQTGPNSWREEQRCLTERGGDAGAYSVTYEVIGTDVIKRAARLEIDGSVEEDLWKFCPPETVPENARFAK